MRAALETAPRIDGKLIAGFQSALAKTNLQVPETDPVVLPGDEEELKSLFSQITFAQVPDARTHDPWDNPTGFIKTVRGFVERERWKPYARR